MRTTQEKISRKIELMKTMQKKMRVKHFLVSLDNNHPLSLAFRLMLLSILLQLLSGCTWSSSTTKNLINSNVSEYLFFSSSSFSMNKSEIFQSFNSTFALKLEQIVGTATTIANEPTIALESRLPVKIAFILLYALIFFFGITGNALVVSK